MKRPSPFVLLTSALTLSVLLIVAFHVVPFGMSGVWVWQYIPLGTPLRLLFPAVAFAMLLYIVLGPVRGFLSAVPDRRNEWRVLSSLWIATTVLSLSTSLMHRDGFMQLTTLIINPASNSYFSTALQNPELGSLLRDYDQKMTRFISHAQTQSAGPVIFSGLLYKAARAFPGQQEIADTLLALSPGINSEAIARFSAQTWQVNLTPPDASAALMVAFALIALGSLAVIPIYYLGKGLYNSTVGILAAVGFTLLPSFHSFTPSVDQLYPLVATTILCFVLVAAQIPQRAWLWLAIAGATLALGIFMNMGLITLIPLCIIFWILCLTRQESSLKMGRSIALLLLFCMSLIITQYLLWLVFRFNIIAVFLTSDHLRDELYIGKHRPYIASLVGNLLDFFVFCGVPATLLFCRHLVQNLSGLKQPGATVWKSVAATPLLWSFLFVLLALDLSGKTRGEVGRMWMFLMPCVLIGGAVQAQPRESSDVLESNDTSHDYSDLLILVILQFVQVVVFQYFVRVWGY